MIRHVSAVAVCATLCAAGCTRDPAQASRAFIASGDRYAQQGKYPEAAIEYRNAIKIEPASADAHAKLAGVAWKSHDTKRALDEWIRVAELQPDEMSSRLIRAMVLEASNRRADAQREYERILAEHPGQAVAANNLAWIYLDEGRLDEALGDAAVAKAGLGSAPEVNDTLGWIYYERHQPALAVPLLTESVRARPDNALYRSHLDAARRALPSR